MNYKKIAPRLLLAHEDYQQQGHAGIARYIRTMGLVSAEGSPKPARAMVFLRCDAKASFGGQAKKSIYVNQKRGKIRTAFLPLALLGELSEHKAIKRISLSRRMRPLMDAAPAKVKLPAFKTASGLTGMNVIVGIVDSGIDPNHPALSLDTHSGSDAAGA